MPKFVWLLTTVTATMQRQVELDRQAEDAEMLHRIGLGASCAGWADAQTAAEKSAAPGQREMPRCASHGPFCA